MLSVTFGYGNSFPSEIYPGQIKINTSNGTMYFDIDQSRIQIKDSTKLSLSGGTMSGPINMNSNKITSLATPTASTDAANKSYVDSKLITYKAGTAISISDSTISHSNIGAANTYGPGSNATLSPGSAFYVPQMTTNAQGHVSSAKNITFTLDSSILRTSNIANNLTTTSAGYALDARQGRSLNSSLNTHKSSGDHDSRYVRKAGDNLSGNFKVTGNMTVDQSIYLNDTRYVIWSGGARIFENGAQQLYFFASEQGEYALHLGVHDGMWALNPDVNGNLQLGSSNHRWGTVYATNGTISTSDRNMKNSIQRLDDRYIQMFMKLLPVSFKFNDGTSGRTHIGFIAQDVESAMQEAGLTDIEFAGVCRDQKTIPVEKTQEVESINPETGELEYKTVIYTENKPVDGEYIYSLRYEEFIALNTLMIQKLMERVDALEAKYHD